MRFYFILFFITTTICTVTLEVREKFNVVWQIVTLWKIVWFLVQPQEVVKPHTNLLKLTLHCCVNSQSTRLIFDICCIHFKLNCTRNRKCTPYNTCEQFVLENLWLKWKNHFCETKTDPKWPPRKVIYKQFKHGVVTIFLIESIPYLVSFKHKQ